MAVETSETEFETVEYLRSDGQRKRAEIIPVEVDLSGLSEKELKQIFELSEAVNGMPRIYAPQQHPEVIPLVKAVLEYRGRAPASQVHDINDFLTILTTTNGIHNANGLSVVFPIGWGSIPRNDPLMKFSHLLWSAAPHVPGHGLYPGDMALEARKKVPLEGRLASSVVWGKDKEPVVVENAVRYQKELAPTLERIRNAIALSSNPQQSAYLAARLIQQQTDSESARFDADILWLTNNTQGIDFLFGTGVELYLDDANGKLGAAQGGVYVSRPEYRKLAETLTELFPMQEETAPWKHKKDAEKAIKPILKIVDCVNMAGAADIFPYVMAAQNLPNEQMFRDKHGTIVILPINISKAIGARGTRRWAEVFFDMDQVGGLVPLIDYVGDLMTAEHELGHAAGETVVPEPMDIFKEEYPVLEEGRAEVFAMWSLPQLVRAGIISEEQELAGYYGMLINCIAALRSPIQDHDGARNIMFHYFLKEEAWIEHPGEPNPKYEVDLERTRAAVPKLLAILGDFKAEGLLDEFRRFRDGLASLSRKGMVSAATASFPLGKCMLFPTMQPGGELVMPSTYLEQPRNLAYQILAGQL